MPSSVESGLGFDSGPFCTFFGRFLAWIRGRGGCEGPLLECRARPPPPYPAFFKAPNSVSGLLLSPPEAVCTEFVFIWRFFFLFSGLYLSDTMVPKRVNGRENGGLIKEVFIQ